MKQTNTTKASETKPSSRFFKWMGSLKSLIIPFVMHSPFISLKFRSQVHLYDPLVLVQYCEQVPNSKHSSTSEKRETHPSLASDIFNNAAGMMLVWAVGDYRGIFFICVAWFPESVRKMTLKRPLAYGSWLKARVRTENRETFTFDCLFDDRWEGMCTGAKPRVFWGL